MGEVMDVNTDTFETEVLEAQIPVMVDFWAAWCAPCRMMAPVMEEISQEMQGRLKVVKLNVDNNQDVAQRYGIRSIPTVMVFRGGEEINRLVGFMAKAQLLDKLGKV